MINSNVKADTHALLPGNVKISLSNLLSSGHISLCYAYYGTTTYYACCLIYLDHKVCAGCSLSSSLRRHISFCCTSLGYSFFLQAKFVLADGDANEYQNISSLPIGVPFIKLAMTLVFSKCSRNGALLRFRTTTWSGRALLPIISLVVPFYPVFLFVYFNLIIASFDCFYSVSLTMYTEVRR